MRVLSAFLAVLALATLAVAQPRPPQRLAAGTSAIRGTVTDALTNAPVPNCTVQLSTVAERRSSTVTTGGDGAYEFANIADGTYVVGVRCPSHLPTCLPPADKESWPCSNITLFRDQLRSDQNIRLVPGAVVRGRVVNSAGKPIAMATVRLGRSLKDEPGFLAMPSVTDADGVYQLHNVPAGEWRLEVDLPPSPRSLRLPTVYYPGALTQDGAGAVEVTAGAAKDNVTITVPSILDSTVTVQVPPPDGTMTAVRVALVRAAPLATYPIEIDADGRGSIKGLTEGRYFVTATAMSGQQEWVAFQGLDFIGDPIEVSLNLQPVGGIRGRIVTERAGTPAMDGARVAAVWIEDDVQINPIAPEEGRIAADGTFQINGLFGRRMLQLIGFDPDWRIRSVLLGRTDVTVTGVDITPNSTTEITVVVSRR